MKTLSLFASFMLMSACADAETSKLDIVGEPLPAVRHIVEMKMVGDTLLFAFETEDGYGQRLLRRAVLDSETGSLTVSPDMGKLEDGYYVSVMPYPFAAEDGSVRAVGQDDCEIYAVNDTVLVRTGRYLMDGNSSVPIPLSRYVRDVFAVDSGGYVFIGREPKGGRQFAMRADIANSKADTIRQICISPELQAWMPNMGEMAYSDKNRRLAFAYRLHPAIELFGLDGELTASLRFGEDTFDPKTLEEADFDDLNVLHMVDVTCTPDHIYALHWGCRHAEAVTMSPTIFQIDWDGNIIATYTDLPVSILNIAALSDNRIIAWTGTDFLLLSMRN